ncbi:amidase [Rhizobium sp. 16-449-1b]|uniref:amidase n=1 Tax=Rhizobium sp. 16-449-1b TaxID=2819989 RepID=UPI001ADCD870|nr:amidase [Rhizobium sp. 16-449-1b]MBO9195947.1 amidase [Rhizobium sp. 16-449-1b]
MNLHDYAGRDAVDLAHLVATRQVSPSDPSAAALAAAERLNPSVNAFVEIWQDEPLGMNGAFAGVPFAVKDIGLSVKGRLTEYGSRLAQGIRFDADSDLMMRFREGGLTPIGRTAIPELAMSVATEPVFGGPTRNPWNLARSAGGSSGGAAAAVAAGIVPVAHATDAGGSIRVPASCTGLVGLKPSRGRVAMGPALDEIWGGLATQFVLTRTVRDSAAFLDLLEGPNVGEPFEITRPTDSYARSIARSPRQLRIGCMADTFNGKSITQPVSDAFAGTIHLLEQMGHIVEPVVFNPGVSWEVFALAVARYWITYNASFMHLLASMTKRTIDLSMVEPASLAVFTQGSATSALDLIAAADVRNQVTRATGRYFQNYDVLMTPTLPDLPAPLGTLHADVGNLDGLGWVSRVLDHAPFSSLANFTGIPAISLPLGHDAETNVPIGMQFASRFGTEDLLLQLAAQLEMTAPWSSRRPSVWAGSD